MTDSDVQTCSLCGSCMRVKTSRVIRVAGESDIASVRLTAAMDGSQQWNSASGST